jgi:ubiquinone biosynthesis protein
MVIDGFFHCDPHPGNIFLTDDGRLALMDFGMVGRFDAGQKDRIILLLLAFSERLGERVADTYLEMIEIPADVDRRSFTQDVCGLVSRYHDMSGGRMAIGTALLDLTRLAQSHHLVLHFGNPCHRGMGRNNGCPQAGNLLTSVLRSGILHL